VSTNCGTLSGYIWVLQWWLCTEMPLSSSDQREHQSPNPIYRVLVPKRLTPTQFVFSKGNWGFMPSMPL